MTRHLGLQRMPQLNLHKLQLLLLLMWHSLVLIRLLAHSQCLQRTSRSTREMNLITRERGMELCMVPLVNLAPVTRTPTRLAVVLQFNSTYPPLLPPTKTPPSHLVQSWGVLLARILKASIHYTFLRLCLPCYKIPHHKTSSINPVFLTRPPCWLPTQAPLTTCSRINQRSSLTILSLDNEFGWATTPLLQSLTTAQLSSPSMERKS